MAQWDVVVIGAGAAGMAAAATAAAGGAACLLVDRMGCGGELMNLGTLHDCAEAEGRPGPDFAAALLEAAMLAGAELGVGEVTALQGPPWRVTLDDDTHEARAVILATGLAHGTLGLANEADFEGQGLSHCAACDGPLYRGKPVVVAGHDRWARQEALELAAICGAVTLVTQGGEVPPLPGVAIIPGAVSALEGEAGLDAVRVGEQRLPAAAIFVQCNRLPALGFAPTMAMDARGRPSTDAVGQTSLAGLYAVGDVRAGTAATLDAALADGRAAAAAVLKALGKASD